MNKHLWQRSCFHVGVKWVYIKNMIHFSIYFDKTTMIWYQITYIFLEIRVNKRMKFYNVAFIQRIWPTFHSLEFANTLLNNGNMPCMLTLKNIKSSKQILPLFISRRKMNLHLRCIENFCLKRNSDPFIRKFLENFCHIFNKKFVWKLHQ